MNATIVKGPFASVSSGNATQAWMVDGADIQARADAAMDKYWGETAVVYESNVDGYGIAIDGAKYIVAVYATHEAAELAISRA